MRDQPGVQTPAHVWYLVGMQDRALTVTSLNQVFHSAGCDCGSCSVSMNVDIRSLEHRSDQPRVSVDHQTAYHSRMDRSTIHTSVYFEVCEAHFQRTFLFLLRFCASTTRLGRTRTVQLVWACWISTVGALLSDNNWHCMSHYDGFDQRHQPSLHTQLPNALSPDIVCLLGQ